jgi:hypothetical protein
MRKPYGFRTYRVLELALYQIYGDSSPLPYVSWPGR